MKVTQIMLSKGWGGAERIFIDLVKGLAEQGVQVQAIMDARFPQRQQLEGVDNVHPVYVRPFSHWDFFAANKLTRAVSDFSPDIIHCHLSRGALMGGRAAKKLSVPAVVTTHNNIKLKYCRNIHQFLVLTESQRRYLTSNGVSDSTITKIPNFSNFEPVIEVIKREAPVFVAYGRFVPKKGFDDLLHAFHKVLQKQPNATLIIGGDGGEKEKLLQLVSSLKLEQHVSFVGWISDVKAFLSQGTVFVLPSRDEPFGIVLLEVMASGVPIVTTRTGGACEILTDETAYFAELADPTSLGEAMVQAIVDPQRQSKAEAALALFNQHYRKNSVVPKTLAYYQSLLPKPFA
jgi:glycosyltransferase involved in cell wall biosynthesis